MMQCCIVIAQSYSVTDAWEGIKDVTRRLDLSQEVTTCGADREVPAQSDAGKCIHCEIVQVTASYYAPLFCLVKGTCISGSDKKFALLPSLSLPLLRPGLFQHCKQKGLTTYSMVKLFLL